MRVEAKDSADPTNMCVATIKDVRAGKVLVHYDGWGDERDFWCDARATDIHPPMWSGKNSKKVTPPKGEENMNHVLKHTLLWSLLRYADSSDCKLTWRLHISVCVPTIIIPI